MIIRYTALSSTLSAEELKTRLIPNIRNILNAALDLVDRLLTNDPDQKDLSKIVKSLIQELEEGNDSPSEWMEIISWAWSSQELDPAVGGGSVCRCTYYAALEGLENVPTSGGATYSDYQLKVDIVA